MGRVPERDELPRWGSAGSPDLKDRLAHPTIRAADRPYPRSVMAGTDAFVCRDLAGLRGRTGGVMRFLWNRNRTPPPPRGRRGDHRRSRRDLGRTAGSDRPSGVGQASQRAGARATKAETWRWGRSPFGCVSIPHNLRARLIDSARLGCFNHHDAHCLPGVRWRLKCA